MCVNNLPRVALDSGEARIRTRDLLIASLHPAAMALRHTYCYQLVNSGVLSSCAAEAGTVRVESDVGNHRSFQHCTCIGCGADIQHLSDTCHVQPTG